MPDHACHVCGHMLSADSRFCGKCGAVDQGAGGAPSAQAGAPEAAPSRPGFGHKRTMFGVAASDFLPAQPAAAAPPPPAPAQPPPGARTMLGTVASPEPKASPAKAPAFGGTMIGVMAYSPPAAPAPPPAPAQAPLPTTTANLTPGSSEQGRGPSPAALRGGGTMLGVAAPDLAALTAGMQNATPMAPTAAAPPNAPASAPKPKFTAAGTTIGLVAGPIPNAPPNVPPTLNSTQPGATAPARPRPGGGTMLGVAIPGIAPTLAGDTVSATIDAPVAPRQAPKPARPVGMLARTIALVAPPPPLAELEPVPELEIVRDTRGARTALFASIGAGLLLVCGGIAYPFLKGGTPLSITTHVDLAGNDVVHIHCPACVDGTTVEIGPEHGTIQKAEADVPLRTALRVGDNDLEVNLVRPAGGRKEKLKVAVPVMYRVRYDASGLAAYKPSLSVIVEAVKGSVISIGGEEVPQDASGKAVRAIDWSEIPTGDATESKPVSQSVPYSVTLPGKKPETGTVTAAAMAAPLCVDAPVAGAVSNGPVHVAGRAFPGDHVSVNGQEAEVTPKGNWEVVLPSMPDGEDAIEVKSFGANLSPRTVRLTVEHAASLEAAAAKREGAPHSAYDVVARDVAAHVGEAIVIEGEVTAASREGQRVVAVIHDRRGCGAGPCLARVITTEMSTVAKGDVLRAYGHVSRAFKTESGMVVPEVLAELVLKGPARKGG